MSTILLASNQATILSALFADMCSFQEPELHDLMTHVADKAPTCKWRRVGIQLKIQLATLNAVKTQEDHDPTDMSLISMHSNSGKMNRLCHTHGQPLSMHSRLLVNVKLLMTL